MMDNKERFINLIERFIKLAAVQLSDDVIERLRTMQKNEDSPVQKAIYESYFKNLEMAKQLNRPCCQDTGMLQFYIKAGTAFIHLDIVEEVLTEAVRRATKSVPLRPNAVNYFDEYITEDNTGERCPWIHWEIIPNSPEIEITLYFSGAGCSLPGQAKVFKPADGQEAIIPFVYAVVYGPGVNACPPLVVGIGLGHNIENAALLSKKALLRPLGISHHHPQGAALEKSLHDGLNSLGMGAQGLRGNQAVMAVHIESSARHTATRACAVNVSCYAMRRGIIKINNELQYKLPTYSGEEL